jgi:Protein of unknown function (DUF642)
MGRSNVLATRIGAVGLLVSFVWCAFAAAGAMASHATRMVTAQPNRLVNGGFALPASAFSNGLVGYLSPQGDAVNKLPVKRIPGWEILEGSTNGAPNPNAGGIVVYQKARLQAPNGSAQSLQLSDNGPGAVSQTVKTTPGASYLLSWYGAGYPDGKSVKIIKVLWNGSTIASPSFKGATGANMGWKVHHEVVKADSTTSTVEFADGTSPTDPYGPLIGAVSLTRQTP